MSGESQPMLPCQMAETQRPRSTSPLPLAGEVDALDRARRVGESIHKFQNPLCGGTPTPTLPRKRERERTSVGERPEAHN
jgi:hypothetical protein